MGFLKIGVKVLCTLTLLSLVYLLGYISSAEGSIINTLKELGGGNVLSPFAVLFSASIASLAAFGGLAINGKRERKKWTLDHLGYKRFSWAGMRLITPCMQAINEYKRDNSDEAFDLFIKTKREEHCKDLTKLISFLDSYQQLAVGIYNGLYSEDIAKLICKDKAIYLYNNAQIYISWRRNADISGIADEHRIYEDFERLVNQWNR